MSTTEMGELCREAEEAICDLLDGTAPARLHDHVAECDACRDLKHEVAAAAARVRDAGADFVPAAGFVDALVDRLAAARPVSSGSKPVASASLTQPATSVVVDGSIEPGAETAATVFDPFAATKASEGEELAPPAKTEVTQPSVREAPQPSSKGVSAATQPGPVTPRPSTEASAVAAEVRAHRFPSRPATPPAKAAWARRPVFLAGAALAMAAAAAFGFYLKGRAAPPHTATVDAPWSGKVATVSRASSDKTGGLEACDAAGTCATVAGGDAVRPGATLRTDARTRARVTLEDGTELVIDRASEVEIDRGRSRAARIKRGTVVADVAHVDGSTARLAFPRGEVEVLGTKLAITTTDDRASIEVARGAVRVTTDAGKAATVRAGEEAMISGGADPVVSSSTTLADVMEWSDERPEDVDSPVLRGIGELRARRPGQTAEKDRAVRLAKHSVKVRVVDVMARTEVDETFTNDTDEELEGIFRFPLPPGAQIEKLSLEVDGKLVDGAFVDRDKGAAIWRGVIQNAAPKAPRPKEEIIWVPGPWRDPALLEWQRGGRFELKIFPIPRRGSRRVVLAYTQLVEQSAGVRRFTYPLAHDASGSTRIGAFDLDVQVIGLDRSMGLATRGYDLAPAPGEGEHRTLHADNFVPAGDLTVEYALPDRDKAVTTWAYTMPAVTSVASPTPSPIAERAPRQKPADELAAKEAADVILDDRSPYVAIALRPRLPRWQEAKERLHVLVVDASRSMFGERFARATHLASSIVREMDRRDSFLLLACDTVCRPMAAQPGGAAEPAPPGAEAAGDVERFLGSVEPEGGSDLAAAMAAARTAAGALGGRELRIVYLGDGTPTVGPTKPAHLEAAVRDALPAGEAGDVAVVAVALGADADTTSLAALARGGGGVLVPYVPGQRIATAALEVLGAAYGVVLRDPEVELPAGLSQVTPAHVDPIRAGGETILVARMTGSGEVSGDLRLRGRVAGERFEQTYPLRVLASSSAGNAFVPRLYAAAKIAELERASGEAQRATIVELSRRFAVASRFTSLLVLESEAMFKAFGLERTASAPAFTGEQGAESATAQAEGDAPRDTPDEVGLLRGPMGGHVAAKSAPAADAYKDDLGNGMADQAGGPAAMAAASAAPTTVPPMEPAAPAAAPRDFDMKEKAADVAPSPHPARKIAGGGAASGKGRADSPDFEGFERRRRFIPMHKVFDRHVGFDAANAFVAQNAAKLAVAESALAAAPDSRDRTVQLFALYATSGRVGEAQELTARWAGRDALDPDALQARADLAARQGDRERAVRILGGLADVRPNDRAVQTHLAELWEAAGNAALACEHRVALADMAASEPKLVAAAVGCTRARGMISLAAALRLDTTDRVRDAVDTLLASPPAASPAVHGDVQIAGTWADGADLDLALIDAQGRRISWLGSPVKATVVARDVTSTRGETLEIAGLPQGSYLLEITRAAGRDAGPAVSGTVTLRLNGETRTLPFTLTGARAEVGTVRVFFTSRLEPVPGGGGTFRW
jgi:ferric-dicitrate binding protein FerR (iron transport regulator)